MFNFSELNSLNLPTIRGGSCDAKKEVSEQISRINDVNALWAALDEWKRTYFKVIVDRRKFKWIVEGSESSYWINPDEFASRWEERIVQLEGNSAAFDQSFDIPATAVNTKNALLVVVKSMDYSHIDKSFTVVFDNMYPTLEASFLEFEKPHKRNIYHM
jgi:hypothetical protein